MEKLENEIYRIKPVEELRFTDDFMFCRVMQNPELCKGVIERLLEIKVERIEYPELQKEIRPYYSAHGVRMDVYVKDSDRIFDIEMQTSVPDDLPRRMRYYQSMIDIDTLIKGSEYETLKESYVIFLCTKDPFGLGPPVYSFSTVCKEKKDIEQRVERLKINEIFRSDYMMDALPLHDARKAGLKEGIALGEKRGILAGERNKAISATRKLLEMNLLTIEQIAAATQLSVDEVLKIKQEI